MFITLYVVNWAKILRFVYFTNFFIGFIMEISILLPIVNKFKDF